jgi:hypothetical protein
VGSHACSLQAIWHGNQCHPYILECKLRSKPRAAHSAVAVVAVVSVVLLLHRSVRNASTNASTSPPPALSPQINTLSAVVCSCPRSLGPCSATCLYAATASSTGAGKPAVPGETGWGGVSGHLQRRGVLADIFKEVQACNQCRGGGGKTHMLRVQACNQWLTRATP